MPDNEKLKNWQYRGLPIEERFRERYVVTDSGCWQWQWGLDSNGYASLHYKGKTTKAATVSYLLHKGDIPEGMEIDYLCENRACVNPNHLEAVTHQVNIARGSVKKRKSHCLRGHPLEGDNVAWVKGNRWRYCIQCNRIRATVAYDKIRKGN